MRVLMLNYEFPPLGGGAANACYYMLSEFAKQRGLTIDLITASPKGYQKKKFSKNITIYKLPVGKKHKHYWTMREIATWTLKAFFFSRKLLAKNTYQLSHCWFGWPSGIIGLLNKTKVPYLVALRGSDVPGFNPRLKFLDKVLFTPLSQVIWKYAEKVTANSKAFKSLARKTSSVPITVIPNGVNTKQFKPSKKSNKKTQLLCVGRLIERKGIEYLIKAMQSLDAQLTIIGDGNIKSNLKQLAKEYGVAQKVRFLGSVSHDKLPKHYRAADIFVLPSLNEGMSNTVLEALASGLALVVTNTGGTKELVTTNGIIIPKKNARAIVHAVTKITKNKKTLARMKRHSRTLAENMSWKAVAQEYKELYTQCISKR